MSLAIHSEILSLLASVREDVWQHVEELDRYRAVKAIEKTIADFPGLDDLTGSLTDIRDRMQERLGETREYHALRAVEKMMPELTSVLVLLSERSGGVHPPAVSPQEEPTGPFASVPAENPSVPVEPSAAAAGDAIEVFEIAEASPLAATVTGSSQADPVEDRDEVVDPMTSDPDFQPVHREMADYSSAANQSAQPQTSSPPTGEGAPASSLAYSLAQLMVQALVPPPATPPEGADGEKIETDEPVQPADHSATQRAGRAA